MSHLGHSRRDRLRAMIGPRPLRPESRSEIRHAPTTQASAVAGSAAQLAAGATARAGYQTWNASGAANGASQSFVSPAGRLQRGCRYALNNFKLYRGHQGVGRRSLPAYEAAAITLYAARGRLIPFNSNSPTGSTFTAFSTFVRTRGLMRICPGFASSHSREATLDTVPIAA